MLSSQGSFWLLRSFLKRAQYSTAFQWEASSSFPVYQQRPIWPVPSYAVQMKCGSFSAPRIQLLHLLLRVPMAPRLWDRHASIRYSFSSQTADCHVFPLAHLLPQADAIYSGPVAAFFLSSSRASQPPLSYAQGQAPQVQP